MHRHDQPVIDEGAIWAALEREARPDAGRIAELMAKAREGRGLDLTETAALLGPMTPEQQQDLYAAAFAVKEAIYGKRMVLFAPLYVSNLCANNCAYCAFSADNPDLKRRSLSDEELAEEVRILQRMGHKRVMAVYGEHPDWDAQAIADSIAVIYAVKTDGHGEIRRANINCAPLDHAGFATLKQIGIGTYQCFQETYHKATYASVHKGGRKKEYDWRLYAMHRAQRAGLDDVGLGVLFGLFDHRFEMLALLQHAQALEAEFGAGPHTVSFPRIEPAHNSPMSHNPPNAITDDVFKRIIAVARLAMPYTGMIITTREKPELKRELLQLGISQLSAGSRTYPGAYADALVNRPEAQQFLVGDERSLAESIADLQAGGFMPSFCTSCYRNGRTGEHFMGFAKTAFIHNFCQPNALTSYYEYLCDYADPALYLAGAAYIEQAVDELPDEKTRRAVRDRLERIRQGERDIVV